MSASIRGRRLVLQWLAGMPVVAAAAGAATTSPAIPPMVVHKSPTCGCCSKWVTHMQSAGFTVSVVESDNLDALKTRVGIPPGKGSCHTGEIDGYFVEGHVPAAQVKRLLQERPRAKGLTVPGMPSGSPGMEGAPGAPFAYDVLLVLPDGSTRVFEHVSGVGGRPG